MVKNSKFIIIYILVILLVSSCGKKDIQKRNDKKNSREYITETGFKEETTERETAESTTQKFDITTHPELWLTTDKDTLQNLLNGLFNQLSKENQVLGIKDYLKDIKLSDSFKVKYNLGKFCLGLVTPLDPEEYNTEPKHVGSVKYTDEEFVNKQFRVYTSNWAVTREHTFSFELDKNDCIDSIRLIKTELIYDYRHDVDDKEYETFSDEETKIEGIKMLVQAEMDEFETWKNYDWTSNFISNFDVAKGLIYGLDQYAVDEIESNDFTDFDNKCIGLTIIMRDDTKLKYKIYFDVDVENKIDSITKVEEVLDDGTIIEVENNFGK